MVKDILVLLYYSYRALVWKYNLTYTGSCRWYRVTISCKSSDSESVIATEPITQERVNFSFQIIFDFVSIQGLCSNLQNFWSPRRIGITYWWNLLISSLTNTWSWEGWYAIAIFTRVVYTPEEIELWDTNRELCEWWPGLTDLPRVWNFSETSYDRVWPIYPWGVTNEEIDPNLLFYLGMVIL